MVDQDWVGLWEGGRGVGGGLRSLRAQAQQAHRRGRARVRARACARACVRTCRGCVCAVLAPINSRSLFSLSLCVPHFSEEHYLRA